MTDQDKENQLDTDEKELPFFAFNPTKFLNGRTMFLSLGSQGLWIQIVSWFWSRKCMLKRSELEKRIQLQFAENADTYVNEIITEELLWFDQEDHVRIDFLDEERKKLVSKYKLRSSAGRKGGRAKASNAKRMVKQTSSTRKEKDKKRQEESEIPSLEVFLEYAKLKCLENGFDFNAMRSALSTKYSAWREAGWKKGVNADQAIKNWKTTLLNTLPHLKPERSEAQDRDFSKSSLING